MPAPKASFADETNCQGVLSMAAHGPSCCRAGRIRRFMYFMSPARFAPAIGPRAGAFLSGNASLTDPHTSH